MREEDAKTKECPNKFLSASLCVSMTSEDKGMTAEDFARIMDSTHCIASDCAMWEPYKYWKDEKGSCFQNESEGRTLVEGGDCGLKTKECEGGCRL